MEFGFWIKLNLLKSIKVKNVIFLWDYPHLLNELNVWKAKNSSKGAEVLIGRTCPCVSPADFPASNLSASPKSATQAVRLFFSSMFLLLISLQGNQKTLSVPKLVRTSQHQNADRVWIKSCWTCERWRPCGRLCVPGCLRAGRPGRGLPSERCGTARSRRPRWPSGSRSGSPEEGNTRDVPVFRHRCRKFTLQLITFDLTGLPK